MGCGEVHYNARVNDIQELAREVGGTEHCVEKALRNFSLAKLEQTLTHSLVSYQLKEMKRQNKLLEDKCGDRDSLHKEVCRLKGEGERPHQEVKDY